MKQVNDYNGLANVYDILARVVFGNTLLQASSYFLTKLNSTASILIVGGGTGKILNDIPEGISVEYIEYSEKMLNKSKHFERPGIQFIHADFFRVELVGNYDYVIFPFFLDMFPANKITEAIHKTRLLLKPSGRLIITDFQPTNRLIHKLLVQSMILFFRVSTRLELKRLEDIKEILNADKFEEEEGHTWNDGMIFSSIYHFRETFGKHTRH